VITRVFAGKHRPLVEGGGQVIEVRLGVAPLELPHQYYAVVLWPDERITTAEERHSLVAGVLGRMYRKEKLVICGDAT
jgi:hypothetical protein